MLVEALLVLLVGGISGYSISQYKEPVPPPPPVERVNPALWTQEEQQDQMLMCKKACEPTTVLKYEPLTGDCSCNSGK